MKLDKKSLKLARQLVRANSKNGELDEKALERSFVVLRKNPNLQSRTIMKALLSLLEKETSKKEIRVESAFSLSREESEGIKKHFETSLKRKMTLVTKINKDLIGGIKIKVADREWENSVLGNINSLRNENV